MPAPHPRMHGLTHRPGGPDPIPAIGGIQFDTSPQEGGYLLVTTTEESITLYSADDVNITGSDGVYIDADGAGGLNLSTDGTGLLKLFVGDDSGMTIQLVAPAILRIIGLPTTDPGGPPGTVWNDGGTLKIK